MGYRFRRSIKIGGLRFNLYRSGVSVSTGIRGANITAGQRGIFSNVGIPGTGLSYRSKIAGGNIQPNIKKIEPARPNEPYKQIRVKFVIDDETGETSWKNEKMEPLDEAIIQVAKKQNREAIYELLQKTSDGINDKISNLLNIHYKTPPPDTIISYTPLTFQVQKPASPNISDYKIAQPEKPLLKEKGFLSKNVSFIGKHLEKSNQKKIEDFNEEMKKWKSNQIDLDKKFELAKQEYEERLALYEKEKMDFEKEQAKIKQMIEVDRLNNPEVMSTYLEEYLDALDWTTDTNISFELNENGDQIWISVDLPEIEMMPKKISKVNHNKLNLSISEISRKQQQINYLTHIHSIAFRIIGETFVSLPKLREIFISGYSQRPNKKTGYIGDEYLYSIRIQRDEWVKINYSALELINIVDCFTLFDLRRTINKSGLIEPIEPFLPQREISEFKSNEK